jgi:hypothetical protein
MCQRSAAVDDGTINKARVHTVSVREREPFQQLLQKYDTIQNLDGSAIVSNLYVLGIESKSDCTIEGVNQVHEMTLNKFCPWGRAKSMLIELVYAVCSLPASWEYESICCENISALTFSMATCLVSNFRRLSVYHAGRRYPQIFVSVRRRNIGYPC